MYRIGILLYPGVDLMDAAGPYEVFLTATRLVRRTGAEAPFEVLTVADGSPVLAYGGLGLTATHTVAECPALDVVVIPGTVDIDAASADPAVMQAVRSLSERSTLVTSVCTGAFLISELGLLTDRNWTTHWEDIAELAHRVPSSQGTTARFVDAGPVITAGGLSCGIDMALHVVRRLSGADLAIATARQLDYAWDSTEVAS